MKDAVDAIRDANAESKRQLRKEMDAFRVEILQTKPIKQSDTESAPIQSNSNRPSEQLPS